MDVGSKQLFKDRLDARNFEFSSKNGSWPKSQNYLL